MKESSHLQTKETRKSCRKREQIIGGDEEREAAPPESHNLPLKYGYVSLLGRRRVMDEPMTVMPPEKLPGGYSFLAAYGGSGRIKVAEMCTDKLHKCLEKLPEKEGVGLGKLVKECFTCMYDNWSGQERETFTAVVVVAGDNAGEVVVVNCGGSRAVLWTGGLALPLWPDHNKSHEVVEAEGGTGNVGVVSTSRSQDAGEGGECVKCKRRWEPEVRVMRRDEKSEDFVIIANDGLWKVVGKEMACEVVSKCVGGEINRLPSEGSAASQAAAMLAELAIAKGSEDNITIIVVHLNSNSN